MDAGTSGVGESVFDELAAKYDAWFDESGRHIFASEVEALNRVQALLPRPWLEIGVGSGRFAQALGIELGVDPSYNLIRMARARGVQVCLGWGEQGLFGEGAIGTVFLIVTLCFLSEPLDVLRAASDMLKPSGRLVLGLVLKDSPWGRYYRQQKAKGHPFYEHAVFYGIDDVEVMLRQVGLEMEDVVSTLFQKPGAVARVETPRAGYFPDAGFTVIVAGKGRGAASLT